MADRHVEIAAETKPKESRTDEKSYVFHLTCWNALADGWGEPA